jgi:hypothetical protein
VKAFEVIFRLHRNVIEVYSYPVSYLAETDIEFKSVALESSSNNSVKL